MRFITAAPADSIFSSSSYEGGGTPGALIFDGLRLLCKMFA